METFIWANELREAEKAADEIIKLKDKARHTRYYMKKRKKILRKQKKRDELRDRQSYNKQYYQENKDKILAANHTRYQAHIEERRQKAREHYQANKEEILRRRREKRNADKQRKIKSAVGEY